MLIKSKHLLAALVVAGITAFATQANATTYVAGDLLLGFRAGANPGSATNLIVNLGQADTVYRDAVSNNPSVADISALLTSTYGAGWDTRADLFWGVVGVRTASNIGSAVDGDPVRTNYISRAQSTYSPGTQQSSAWDLSAAGQVRTDLANAIVGFATNYNNFSAAVTNTALLPAGSGSTWTSNNDGNNSFGLAGTIEANFAAGAASTGLDLYRVLDRSGGNPTGPIGTGTYEGTFTISPAGIVGFSATAVPEPSRALLAGLGFAGILFRRRRAKNA